MTFAQKYIGIVRQRAEKELELKKVYRNIQDRELFLMAYGKLYANRGATTQGVNPADTVDEMSLARIDRILEQLNQGHYQWQPVKRVDIPKTRGKTRPLGIPTWSDKILQEVIRLVLEAYYEPQFSPHSHGFRPGKGCHTALQEIYQTWTGTKWFIEGDIKGCFEHIDHDTLLTIVQRNIKDERFLKLLRGMLRAGYLQQWQYHSTYSGTPQGGVASPILANIILNELDKFVESLAQQYKRGQARHHNPAYDQLTRAMTKAQQARNIALYRQLKQQRQTLPSLDPDDPTYRRLKYVRYADDFLIGWSGSRAEAVEIKQKIQSFLTTLKLTLSEDKTLITHATTGRARFLGYDIYVARNNTRYTKRTVPSKIIRRSINGRVVLSVPAQLAQQWRRRFSKNGKPTIRPELLACSDYEIVQTYGAEFQGLVNYYTLAHNVSNRLYPVKHTYRVSLVKTLAAKHHTSTSWVYGRYARKSDQGVRALIVQIPNPNHPDKPLTAKFGDKPICFNPSAQTRDKVVQLYHYGNQNELVRRLLTNTCELCGSTERISVHHIRHLKDIKHRYQGRLNPPPWAKLMMERNRKTVVVCVACHMAIHTGKYDGKKVE
jgi:group II intron reverse transcriptase/maturase